MWLSPGDLVRLVGCPPKQMEHGPKALSGHSLWWECDGFDLV